jgi:MoaA/NifB/PqqE/SkfB family radical SAM enzyme
MDFEVTTRCNLKCAMCPHGVDAMKSVHDADDRVLDGLWALMEKTHCIHLNCIGEPLLARPFWKIIARLEGRTRPKVIINTNGHFLSARSVARLFEAPLYMVNVSLDAARPETYRRLRGSGFEKALDGIHRLVREREVRQAREVKLGVGMVLMLQNIGEVAEFISLAADLGVEFVTLQHLRPPGVTPWLVSRSDGWQFDYHDQHLVNHKERSDRALLEAVHMAEERNMTILGCDSLWFTRLKENDVWETFEWEESTEEGLRTSDNVGLTDCPHPWRWMHVNVDGYASPCSFAPRPIGNILDEGGAAGLWNGPGMRQLREDIAAGRLNPVCAGASCPYPTGSPESIAPPTQGCSSATGLARYTRGIARWFIRK